MAGPRAVPVRKTMMVALFMVVTVLMSTTVLGNKGRTSTPATVTCDQSTASAGISVEVDADTKRASFVCGTGFNQVLPSSKEDHTVTKCYMTEEVGQEENEKSLVELFGDGSEATVKTPSEREQQGSEVTLSLGKLPQRRTTIYFHCTGGSTAAGVPGAGAGGLGARRLAAAKAAAAGNKCVVTVTVPADPAANSKPELCYIRFKTVCGRLVSPQPVSIYKLSSASFSLVVRSVCHCTPGCYSPMPAACTVAKKNMDLEITNESKSVSFQCDTNIDRLNPENPADLIFDESCQNPVKLADMLPSAKLATSTSGYTFSVEELPETAGTFCYKCAAASDPEEEKEVSQPEPNACYVKIQVPQRSNAASTSAFARSVQALLVGLGVSLALFQVTH
ncbi:SRS domain-containing protein [Neospora caninum Liverpool]|uniref:SRS domain-containing protein n=1 Tax=Neospora caninum (strain Liverpool) TaxID=572307 RepID=F0VNU1_NEOCL|nr:SRS domain-containing protein [Neospora caninum Liverpool]CBZ55387.1 SRS domain-containing protein [Neospora caninum Liverpool]CEL70123.1 TPA: SRS domain-containing protein [Neospora caninum Liverpool]|eukprot:XP_003885415.1 SRS domain-containing protein [Neospora caninum Liverpool]